MDMFEELRKKSKGTKDAYAFWGAFIVTALVGIIWVASLSVRFSEVGTVANVETATNGDGAFAQFFEKMKENVSATWQQNREAIEDLGQEAPPEAPAATSTATSSPAVIVATSSQRTILIATTTEQTR